MPETDIPTASRLRPASTTLLLVIGLLSVACSHRADDCRYTLMCGEFDAGGGTGGTSTADSTGGDNGVGGITSVDTSPCAPLKCTGNTHCDSKLGSCVECGDAGNCTEDKPICDGSHRCVQCVTDSDCPLPTKAACGGDNICTGCTSNDNCSRLEHRSICKLDEAGDAGAEPGTCVECTTEYENVCRGRSCNPAKNLCTTTGLASLEFCQACVADSECKGSATPDGGTSTARCVPLKFGDSIRGNYCLQEYVVADGCPQPFTPVIGPLTSLSSVAGARYCGIDQDNTTCEAARDFEKLTKCIKDSDCGCLDSTCTEPGVGGLCRTILGIPDMHCTITCSTNYNCLSQVQSPGGSCNRDSSAYYCQ